MNVQPVDYENDWPVGASHRDWPAGSLRYYEIKRQVSAECNHCQQSLILDEECVSVELIGRVHNRVFHATCWESYVLPRFRAVDLGRRLRNGRDADE